MYILVDMQTKEINIKSNPKSTIIADNILIIIIITIIIFCIFSEYILDLTFYANHLLGRNVKYCFL